MDGHDALRGGSKVVPLRAKTIDDGEIRLGPARVEPLTAAQEAQAVELLDRALRCGASPQRAPTAGGRRDRRSSACRSVRTVLATPCSPWSARDDADLAGLMRARLYKEVPS